MDLQVPRSVRAALYVFTAFGSILMSYLAVATSYIGQNEMAFWTGFTALVATMAGFNLTPPGIAAPPLNNPVADDPPADNDADNHPDQPFIKRL